ncbi:hypothetical protein C8R48DRAFT_779579 [Suillus tomentosus]|nr:hypothetical protein C8R48DRAFT_779579 [Suillus tomentosus]
MGNSESYLSSPKSVFRYSQDFVSKTDIPGSLGPLKDKNAPTLESKGPSLKRKLDFGDLVTPRKRRILESYSTGDICQVATVYSDATPKINRHNTDLTSPTTKRLFREASDIFLKRNADAQLDPFVLKRVISHEPCKTKTFIWSLPVEILIVTVALLGARDLRSVTQVSSLLREIAAPLFFLDRNFPTSPKDLFHIRVDSPNFDVLTTWRRMDTFRPPRMVLGWLEPNLRSSQLSAFSHFLESVPRKSIRYITLFWNFDILTSPVLSQIVTLLETIRASGVEELTCMGFCDGAVSSSVTGLTRIRACVGANNLKAFEASSRVFFSPKLLPFTIQTICLSCCLEKLRLSSVKLSSAHWDKLLRHLSIPTLVELRVDAECAPPTLIRFLARHPAISNLSVIPRPGGHWRVNRVTTPLTLSLSMLDGPLSHLLPVLRSHRAPQNFASLYIPLQAHDASPDYITSILQCISHCDSIGYLVLSLPNSHSSAAMSYLSGAHSTVRIKHLTIDYSDGSVPSAAGDTLALSAAWIQALPQVKRVTLRGYSATAAGDLVEMMRNFAARDVELVVNLQVAAI